MTDDTHRGGGHRAGKSTAARHVVKALLEAGHHVHMVVDNGLAVARVSLDADGELHVEPIPRERLYVTLDERLYGDELADPDLLRLYTHPSAPPVTFAEEGVWQRLRTFDERMRVFEAVRYHPDVAVTLRAPPALDVSLAPRRPHWRDRLEQNGLCGRHPYRKPRR